MLKLTYTEFGLHLEQVSTALDVVVTQRVLLAMRLGQKLHVEPGRASFLVPIDTSGLDVLANLLIGREAAVTVDRVDDEFVEVSLQGSWMAQDAEAYEGTFVTMFPSHVEHYIYMLWEASQAAVSSVV
jgi:hypothetical protein